MSMMSKVWLRKCNSEKFNTICFGPKKGESVYEIELERIATKEDWEQWEYHMSCKNWFTPVFRNAMLNAANAFHGCDIRERSKRFVANVN